MNTELEFVVTTVRAAGSILLDYFGKRYSVRQKGEDNPVTAADAAADDYLREAFSKRFPGDGWLSEETPDGPERLSLERVWVVDPLDGTREFIAGLDEFAVSVALIVKGEPRLAVVYNPPRDDLLTAVKNEGTSRGGRPIPICELRRSTPRQILVSRSEYTRKMFDEIRNQVSLRPLGSIAYRLALVSAGEADASISLLPKNDWDVCAGALMIQESRGVITDLDGRSLLFNREKPHINGIVAATAALHEPMLQMSRRLIEGNCTS